jgi:hypothetical protein
MIARLAGGGEMTKPFEVTRAVCRLGTALAVIASVSFVCNARADDYPNRPITMVVPFAAGGPTDILGRIVAQAIGPTLGQQVVVEDVTGAGGTIGAAKVARAAPDGYTMVMGNLGTHAASVGIYGNLAFRASHLGCLDADGPGDHKDAAGENAQRCRRLGQSQ